MKTIRAWFRWWPAVCLLGITGCAMLEMPTLEDIGRRSAENARRDLTSPDPARRAAAVKELGDEGAIVVALTARPP